MALSAAPYHLIFWSGLLALSLHFPFFLRKLVSTLNALFSVGIVTFVIHQL